VRDEPEDIAVHAQIDHPAALPPGSWVLDGPGSSVGFEIRHLMLTHVQGRFREVAAHVAVDAEGRAAIDASIDVASVDTGDSRRDERICDEDFFDVARHPTISYSGSVDPPGPDGAIAVRGTMTIGPITRPVELLAEPARGGGPADRLHFLCRGEVSRREFGLEWNSAFGGLVIDDRVALALDVRLVRRDGQP
jgi:polyisoprenoid-binding protein YceI